jgi:hypothetical protein
VPVPVTEKDFAPAETKPVKKRAKNTVKKAAKKTGSRA